MAATKSPHPGPLPRAGEGELLTVRGLTKVRCVVRLYALAHNLMRMVALAPQLVGLGAAASAMAATAA